MDTDEARHNAVMLAETAVIAQALRIVANEYVEYINPGTDPNGQTHRELIDGLLRIARCYVEAIDADV